MKTYYHIPGSDIFVFNEDKSLKALTNDDILGTLEYTPANAKKDDAYIIFDNLETAKKLALQGQEENPLEAFPILVLTVEDDAELLSLRVDEEFKEATKGGYKALEVHANQAKFICASLKHASEQIADVVFDADLYKEVQAQLAANPEKPVSTDKPESVDKPADATAAKFDLVAFLKKLTPAGVVGAVGVGFWQSGAIPGVANLISTTVGYGLPLAGTAGIATQVAIAAAVGATAYGAGLLVWTLGKAAVNAASAAWAKRSAAKSDKAKFEEDTAAAQKDVAALEKELGYEAKNAIFDKFAELFSKAPAPAFEGETLAKPEAQPKGLNQLQVLQKEKQLLAEIKAANDAKDDAKRAELEGKITKRGFKFSS